MSAANWSAFRGGFHAELIQLGRSRTLLLLTAIQSVAFLVLVSLFALTGSRAPLAVVSDDQGTFARLFISQLASTHRSFNLMCMDRASAVTALRNGQIVAILTIPEGFSDSVLFGKDTTLNVDVDNIDTDMTDDVQRALPSAIVMFGRKLMLPEVRLHVAEADMVDRDTGYIPYLVVSGLVLDAFVISTILSAMTLAREFERGTIRTLMLSPISPIAPLLGRAMAANAAALGVLLLPASIVVFAYRVHPYHPMCAAAVLIACTVIFSCFGAALGVLLKRTLPVATLVLGLAMPLYICSGSLEPARFDGNRVWIAAHSTPVYYAVGLLENAFHNLQVTPESIRFDCVALAIWVIAILVTANITVRKQLL